MSDARERLIRAAEAPGAGSVMRTPDALDRFLAHPDDLIALLVESGALEHYGWVEGTGLSERVVKAERKERGLHLPSGEPLYRLSSRDLLAEELENNACPVCGEVGPCGFTTDGEPLICAASPNETSEQTESE